MKLNSVLSNFYVSLLKQRGPGDKSEDIPPTEMNYIYIQALLKPLIIKRQNQYNGTVESCI